MSATSSASVSVSNGCPVLCSTEYGSSDSSPAGEHGSCTEVLQNVTEFDGISGDQENTNTADVPCSSARTASPDLNCPICLSRLENRSYTDTCFHKFCFACLVEWSKVKPVCPLCKQPFTSVIHNVQSYEDFEQLPITPGNSGAVAAADSNRSRFRYPTTVIHGSSERRRQRDSLQRPSRLRRRGSSRFDVPPPAYTSSFRRSIYRDELWVRSVSDSSRYRDASAVFFACNPTAVHRLMPWLNRELMALLRNPADVTFLLDIIIGTVLRIDITSETFYDLVAPFLGARTRHFIHEFHTFARSPFNMEAYDTRAIYERPPQIASSSPIEFSDSGSSDLSDAEIVEIRPGASTNESNMAADDDEDAVNEGIFVVGESVASRSHVTRNTPSPQPGPSYLHDISLPEPSRQSHVQNISPIFSEHRCSSSSGRQNVVTNLGNVNSDSDDGLQIIAQDKPWIDRSPVVLSSGDSDTDNVIELLHQAADIASTTDGEVLPGLGHSTVDNVPSAYYQTSLASDIAEVSCSVPCDTQSADRSSCQSTRRHKRAKKHKRKHHRESSHHHKDSRETRSIAVGQHKKCCQRSRSLYPSESSVTGSELKHKALTSSECTQAVLGGCSADVKMWVSDDSSDNDDCQPVRSVVVVPQTFKKHSSGHKRSAKQ